MMKKLNELYEELIDYYSRFYVLPKAQVERRIAKLQKLGYSKEEAIIELYKEVFGVKEVKVVEEVKIKRPKVKVERRTLLNLLSYSYNAYTRSPCLVLSVFFKDSLNYVGSAIRFLVVIYLVNEMLRYEKLLSLGEIILSNINILIVASLLVLITLVLISVAASSVYWSIITSSSVKLFRCEVVRLKDLIESFKFLPKVLKAELLAEFIRSSIFMLIIASRAHTLANLKRIIRLLVLPLMFSPIPLGGLLIFLASLIVYLVLFILTIFVPHEVVIGNKGALRAIIGSFKVARECLRQAIVYIILWSLTLFFAMIISAMLALIHISIFMLISFIVSALIVPTLDIALTGVYLEWTGRRVKLWDYPGRISSVFRRCIEDSLKEVVVFVKSLKNLPFIVLSIILFMSFYALGFHLGSTYFAPLAEELVEPGKLNPILKEILPISLVLEIFFNNWEIAMISSLGGFFYIVPPLSVIVNGLFLGLVTSRLQPIEFLVVVMPHGCLELTAFILAVATGIKFSFTIMVKRTRIDDVLRETVLMAIGLVIPLIVAAFIEVFITPQLARLLLGWK